MAKLITEYLTNLLVEDKGKNTYISGIFSSAELVNGNGRKYRRETLEEGISSVSEKLKNKSLWGELGHPPNPDINMENIAILIENLEWSGNNLLGRAKVLDTPKGRIAKELIKEGNLGISSRGLGTVDEDSGYVNEDYKLITWDLVADPSNKPSWINGIYEGKEWKIEEVDDHENEKLNEEAIEEARKFHFDSIMEFLKAVEKNT